MTAPDPVDPVTKEDCPHCDGTGYVDDDWEVNGQLVGVTFDCNRCDAGRAPVDAHGRCACEDCLHLPYTDRVGSDAPWCDSQFRNLAGRIVACALEYPHDYHLSATRGRRDPQYTWTSEDALPPAADADGWITSGITVLNAILQDPPVIFEPGTLIEVLDGDEREIVLVGHVNLVGGECDDCNRWPSRATVLRYRRVWAPEPEQVTHLKPAPADADG